MKTYRTIVMVVMVLVVVLSTDLQSAVTPFHLEDLENLRGDWWGLFVWRWSLFSFELALLLPGGRVNGGGGGGGILKFLGLLGEKGSRKATSIGYTASGIGKREQNHANGE
jgi:hypothetical protein